MWFAGSWEDRAKTGRRDAPANATSRRTTRGCPGTRISPASGCTALTARSSPPAHAARARRYLRPRIWSSSATPVVARDGFFSFEGRRYHVPDANPGARVELVLGATKLEVHLLSDGHWRVTNRIGDGSAPRRLSCSLHHPPTTSSASCAKPTARHAAQQARALSTPARSDRR